MTDYVVVSYNQTQINEIICELNSLYTDLSSVLAKQWLYSVPCINMCLLKEVFLYRWALNGQLDTNVLTTEELNDIINKVKNLVNNCGC